MDSHRGGAVERVFAGELNRSHLTIERGDRMVVLTPTGAVCGRIFLVGALTEVIVREGEVQRARLSDPTGTIDLVLRPKNLPPADVLSGLVPPAFIAVTGSVRIYGKNAVVHPDMIHLVDRQARDSWVLVTAERTLHRMESLQKAIRGGVPEGETAAVLEYYRPTEEDLHTLAAQVRTAVESVPPERPVPKIDVREVLLEILGSVPGVVELTWVIDRAEERGIGGEEARRGVQALLAEGECYAPRNGHLRLL